MLRFPEIHGNLGIVNLEEQRLLEGVRVFLFDHLVAWLAYFLYVASGLLNFLLRKRDAFTLLSKLSSV